MSKSQSIRVICRIRPENEREKASGMKGCIDVLSENSLKIYPLDQPAKSGQVTKEEPHEFTFDRVFPNTTRQIEVFEFAAKPLIDGVFDGINCTLFCYGQTSSGKTFTMEGIHGNEDLQGIIPRAMRYIFQKITEVENAECSVKCSYYQIYNEKIQDLLDPKKSDLIVREDKRKGIWVEDLTEKYVASVKDMQDAFALGASNRTVSATQMNAGSSRSHSLFVVTIFQKNTVTESTKSAKVFFVDLAGSEKMSKTGITGGMGLKEAQNINKSLMVLGMVINALTEGAQHIPYRDSKLTRVLQESIGGNSQTTLIVTCTSNGLNQSESLSTLRFGQRAKLIKNKVVANTVKSVKELMIIIKQLEEKIKKLEAAKGKITDEDDNNNNENTNNDNNNNSNNNNDGKEDVKVKTIEKIVQVTKCENCEKYINELMNKRVEILTLTEQVDDLEKDKDDLEVEIKDKVQEIYDLNEKGNENEEEKKKIIEKHEELVKNVQNTMEKINEFTDEKKRVIDKLKSSKETEEINNAIDELVKLFKNDEDNCKEILNIIEKDEKEKEIKNNNNNIIDSINEDNNSNMIVYINKDSTQEEIKIEKKIFVDKEIMTEEFINEKEKIEIDDKVKELKEDKEIIKQLNIENDILKSTKETLINEKNNIEKVLSQLNDKVKEMNKIIFEKDERMKELNSKNISLTKKFEDYKKTVLETISQNENNAKELINNIKVLESENLNLKKEIDKRKNIIFSVDNLENIILKGKEKIELNFDDQEHLSIKSLDKPILILNNLENIEIKGKEKPNLSFIIQEQLSIKEKDKPKLINQNIEQLIIKGKDKPKLVDQNIEQLVIQGKDKPKLINQNIEQLVIKGKDKPKLINQNIEQLVIKGKDKPKLINQNIEKILIKGKDKPKLINQNIEKILIKGKDKPKLINQNIEQLIIKGKDKPKLINQNIEKILIKGKEKPKLSSLLLEKISITGKEKPEIQLSSQIQEDLTIKGKEKEKINLLSSKLENISIKGKEKEENTKKEEKLNININQLQISQNFNISSSLKNEILKYEKSTQISKEKLEKMNNNKKIKFSNLIFSVQKSFYLKGREMNNEDLISQISRNEDLLSIISKNEDLMSKISLRNEDFKFETLLVEKDLKVKVEYREIDRNTLEVFFKTNKDENLILHWGVSKNKNWYHPKNGFIPPNSRKFDQYSIDTQFIINNKNTNEKIIHLNVKKGQGHSRIDGLSFVFYNPYINKWYNNYNQDYLIKFRHVH